MMKIKVSISGFNSIIECYTFGYTINPYNDIIDEIRFYDKHNKEIGFFKGDITF